MKEDDDIPIILGRSFLATRRALIDVHKGQLILRCGDEQFTFNVFKSLKHPSEANSCFQIDIIDIFVVKSIAHEYRIEPLEACLVHSESKITENLEIEDYVNYLEASPPIEFPNRHQFEEIGEGPNKSLPSIQHPTLKLKPLPVHLKYAYLGKAYTLSVITASSMIEDEEKKLHRVLREHNTAIGWSSLT